MSFTQTIRFIVGHPINRGHRLRALLRYAKWQFGSRMVPGDVAFTWVNDSKLLARPGETGVTGNIYTGLHEFPDMGFLLHFLRKGDLFVDVGANIGSYAILAGSAVGAKTVAFEPIPRTFERLVDNVLLNRAEDLIRCMNMAIGAENESVLFTSDEDTTNHAISSAESSRSSIPVEVTTLDQALANEHPVLMKIDVEGYETLVLRGCQKTLESPSVSAVIIELNGSGSRYGFEDSDILRLMLQLGFETCSYDPFSRKLTRTHGMANNSGNTLFVRNVSMVEARLQDAKPFSIFGRAI